MARVVEDSLIFCSKKIKIEEEASNDQQKQKTEPVKLYLQEGVRARVVDDVGRVRAPERGGGGGRGRRGGAAAVGVGAAAATVVVVVVAVAVAGAFFVCGGVWVGGGMVSASAWAAEKRRKNAYT